MGKKPYIETRKGNVINRVFDANVNESELTWHRDREDRLVTVLNENDWMIQFDNELPKKLNVNESIIIPKNTYHRVIKGKNELKIKIVEGDIKDLKLLEKNSKLDKNYLAMKLHETFHNSEPMVEPQVKPKVEPKPNEVQPNITPSRRNKPFIIQPNTLPKTDPKASK